MEDAKCSVGILTNEECTLQKYIYFDRALPLLELTCLDLSCWHPMQFSALDVVRRVHYLSTHMFHQMWLWCEQRVPDQGVNILQMFSSLLPIS